MRRRNNVKVEGEKELETGFLVRIKSRVLGRRKLANIWGEEEWSVESRVKGTSAYKLVRGSDKNVENRINLKLINI